MAKVILDVDEYAWRELENFAIVRGWDGAEFVRRAIGTEQFLIERENDGWRVFLVSEETGETVGLQIGPMPLRQRPQAQPGPQTPRDLPDDPIGWF